MAHITLLRVIPTVTHNSDIVSDIPAGSKYGIYSEILSDIHSDIYSDILSGIYSGILSDFLANMYWIILDVRLCPESAQWRSVFLSVDFSET